VLDWSGAGRSGRRQGFTRLLENVRRRMGYRSWRGGQ